jgi:hypothetical protein
LATITAVTVTAVIHGGHAGLYAQLVCMKNAERKNVERKNVEKNNIESSINAVLAYTIYMKV